jgi:hypothetical protein
LLNVVHATCDATTDKRRLTPFHNAARHVKNDLLEDNVDLFILEGRRQKLLQADVTRLLKGEIIEERESSWTTPVVLVPKPDSSIHLCVDHCQLNEVTTSTHLGKDLLHAIYNAQDIST